MGLKEVDKTSMSTKRRLNFLQMLRLYAGGGSSVENMNLVKENVSNKLD